MKRGKRRPMEELLARKDDFKKGENYHFHELLPDAAGNRKTRRARAGRGAGAPLRRT